MRRSGVAPLKGGAAERLRRLARAFGADRRGNYGLMTVVGLIPIMGGLALALDFAEMTRQKQAMMHALDAAGIATARQIVSGASEAELRVYARDFFEANLGPVNPSATTLHVQLPDSSTGGGTLKLSAELQYDPYFLPVFRSLIKDTRDAPLEVDARTELRLKNTLEVALVLDNSGSMDYLGAGSGEKRIALLKKAAKQLVDTLAEQANLIKQVDRPVQFSLVPFAASVNVGPHLSGSAWMDTTGLSPVHHEHFDWSGMTAAANPNKYAERSGTRWYKRGTGWGDGQNQPLTRFSLYQDMKKVVSRERVEGSRHYVCYAYKRNGTCDKGGWEWDYDDTPGPFTSWQGCVEARPYPYNVNDAPASEADPASLFVPMFAPDEPGDRWKLNPDNPVEPTPRSFSAYNNWWNDGIAWTDANYASASAQTRMRAMAKYFDTRPLHAPTPATGSGPNQSCTTRAITPLTDVTVEEGLATIKGAIEGMEPVGGTNVPEGLAWGWRTLSSHEPFTGGRAESERGNDKIVIVLTDGENTYYTPSSLGASDPAGLKSTYSAYGYLAPGYAGTGEGRLFLGTSASIGRFDYSNTNYSNALNEQMKTLCSNAKAGGLILMTVALDLNAANAAQAAQIAALRDCASESRFRKDAANPSAGAKLFWNATGDTLDKKFKEIADELSNLRIVG